MKLGVGYNIWDCEELLERSIESIRPNVDFVVVVYQEISNFGTKCSPYLTKLLNELKEKKLIDEIIKYDTKFKWNSIERESIISKNASKDDYGGDKNQIGTQFLNEVEKRELGRKAAENFGCTHFMTMDADEFYLKDQMKNAKEFILKNNLQATACRMRILFKEAIYEFLPFDNSNAVPFICKIEKNRNFRLAVPSNILLDPTRKVENAEITLLDRGIVEMYHMSFVRKDIRSKLNNVSNKANYISNTNDFVRKFALWRNESDGVLHPHPHIGRLFSKIGKLKNHFNVDLNNQCIVCRTHDNLQRCSVCKWAFYCCNEHQRSDWLSHQLICQPPK